MQTGVILSGLHVEENDHLTIKGQHSTILISTLRPVITTPVGLQAKSPMTASADTKILILTTCFLQE